MPAIKDARRKFTSSRTRGTRTACRNNRHERNRVSIYRGSSRTTAGPRDTGTVTVPPAEAVTGSAVPV